MWKKLISLNLVFVLIISMLPFGAVATETQITDEAPEKKLVVDGVVYNATQNHSGDGWEYFYHVGTDGVSARLWLTDYTGGPIASDIETYIFYEGQNTILAKENYGIYCGRNLSVDGSYQRASHLSVTGANDCPAVYAKGALSIGEVFTAAGDNTSALISEENIYIRSSKALEILAGSDAASAIEVDNYDGQKYVSTTYQELTLVLNGAGGYTVDQESTVIQTVDDFDVWLEDYAFLFTKPGASLIGWKDEDGSIYGTKQHFSIGNSPTFLTALWNDGEYDSITLKNYYGYYDYGTDWSNSSLIRDELTIPVLPNTQYLLPDLSWSGIVFIGWKDDNDRLFNAKTDIDVDGHMTFTAQVEELQFEIDGEVCNATNGCRGAGWNYSPGDDHAFLHIRDTYTGSTINFPSDIVIQLDTSITGNSGEPAVFVDGNTQLYTSSANLVVLTGGEDTPAVIATKEAYVGVSNRGNSFVLQGGDNAPAIRSNSLEVSNDCIFNAGEDAESSIVTNAYSGQHYVRLDPSPRIFTLNNYYGIPENDSDRDPLMGESLYVSLPEGSRYTLPDITWTGIQLIGWESKNGDIIPAGTSIFVYSHAAFTAIIKESYVEIGGEEYPASKPASGTGWSYEPGKYESTLIISEDYDGSPIKVPNDVQIELAKSLIGENGQPAITVNGNAAIHATAEASGTGRAKVSLTGGSGAPAVTATGKLRLWAFGDSDLIVQAGASAESAIQAEEVVIYDRIFHTGDDASTLSTVGRYSGEKYVELQGISQHQISVSTGELVPEVPEHAYWAFVMWRDITNDSNDDSVWYAPGDRIEGEDEKLLEAKYIYADDTGSAFVYDGNSAKTEYGSDYHVVFASPTDLKPYLIASNAFVNDEFDFEAYSSEKDGSGARYLPGEPLAYDNSIRVYVFYAQWRENVSELPEQPTEPPTEAPTRPERPDRPDRDEEDEDEPIRPTQPATEPTTEASTQPDKPQLPLEPVELPFTDVQDDQWYTDGVQYVYQNKLMNGVSEEDFGLNDTTNRGMIMTVLARAEGVDTSAGATWYEVGMEWAKAEGVSDGTAPDRAVSRQELVTMLWRHAGQPRMNDADLAALGLYPDRADVSDWAYQAMAWAIANGIINGIDGDLAPTATATRAQVATILMRYLELQK